MFREEEGTVDLDVEIVRRVVKQALEEDVGTGDVTTQSVLRPEACIQAQVVAREAGVIAGLPVAAEVFGQLSPEASFTPRKQDGDRVARDEWIAEVGGPAAAILSAERVALNFLQRLSGIATLTSRCVDAVKDNPVRIMDTRKTTPGLRHLEKYAVRMGGGTNHRMGLYDQVLIKDNHLCLLLSEAGDLPAAVRLAVARAREAFGDRMAVEVEAETLPMVQAALDSGADIIMLDNMSLEDMGRAASMVRNHREERGSDRPVTEASGGLTPEKLALVAATGVDAVSLGALTHSAPALDMALVIAD